MNNYFEAEGLIIIRKFLLYNKTILTSGKLVCNDK